MSVPSFQASKGKSSGFSGSSYVVVSPVKDEERYVERTLRSMEAQTVKPAAWIIVDDGSTDRTPLLLEEYARKYDFIRIVRIPPGAPRQPGSAVVRAFARGYSVAVEMALPFDYVVKLDCDLSFDPDYFEQLLAEFAADPRLGIASGVYQEETAAGWKQIDMPSYHAAGASKMIRRECWDAIGGFIASRGWDTVDEIRAMTRGWKTKHFPAFVMKHWKIEGAGIGPLRTSVMHGEIYYLTGGGPFFFLFKFLHRLKARPFLLAGFAMGWGYLRACVLRQRLVTDDEATCYRSLLNGRISRQLARGTHSLA
jgi:poly-beta-1,6-N-acetyl-D-glucosamine synthase